jgi:hypothetical protein
MSLIMPRYYCNVYAVYRMKEIFDDKLCKESRLLTIYVSRSQERGFACKVESMRDLTVSARSIAAGCSVVQLSVS